MTIKWADIKKKLVPFQKSNKCDDGTNLDNFRYGSNILRILVFIIKLLFELMIGFGTK